MSQAFASKIKELRTINKLSQTEFATAFHITKQTVSAWENNLQETDFSMLTQIAKFFDVSTDYLLGLED